MKVLSYLFW